MKTTITLAAIAMAAAFLLSSAATPAFAGGLLINKPIFVERPDKPMVKPDTRPGGDHDGEWHVEHDELDPVPPGDNSDTPLAGPDHPPEQPQGNNDGGNSEEGDTADKAAALTCELWPDTEFLGGVMDFMQIHNTGNAVLTAGTIVEIVLGDGTVYQWIVPTDIVPGGTWAFYSTLQADFPVDTGLEGGLCDSEIVIA